MAFLKNTFLLLALATLAVAQDFVLESERITDWGTWAETMELCQPGSFVYGMQLKTHRDQGLFTDDTALNGIEFLCINPTKRVLNGAQGNDTQFTTITSLVGNHGAFGRLYECPAPEFATGFQLRQEDEQSGVADDTAGNNVRLVCAGGSILEGDGETWGDWTSPRVCPRGLRICGIQTQVEGDNPDETAFNNVNIGCCA